MNKAFQISRPTLRNYSQDNAIPLLPKRSQVLQGVAAVTFAAALATISASTGEARAWAEPSDSAISTSVPSSPPATAKATDGWSLVLSANSETVMPAPPLDPGVPSRDFIVGGLFNGTLRGPSQSTTPTPSGKISVGYQVQCLPGSMLGALKPSVVDFKVLDEEFKGADPAAAVTDFRVQIDCAGRAFIRSYAILTRTTSTSNAIVAYYGVPNPV